MNNNLPMKHAIYETLNGLLAEDQSTRQTAERQICLFEVTDGEVE